MINGKQFFLLAAVVAIPLLVHQQVGARNQWDINHPEQPLPSGTIPGSQTQGRNLGMDFWTGQHPMIASRVQPGVVLTTVMEHDLSSATAKVGDVFSLRLDDGYVRNGMQVIPVGSRIICSVTAVTPARNLRGGLAGRLDVSLQSLVFPDGQHVPIYGFIDSNPNHAFDKEPVTRNAGSDIRDYGQQVSAMFGSFTSGLGTTMAKRHRGLDFELDKGELIPVRLNRTLIVPESIVQPYTVQSLQSGTPSPATTAPTQAAGPEPGPPEQSAANLQGAQRQTMPPNAPPMQKQGEVLASKPATGGKSRKHRKGQASPPTSASTPSASSPGVVAPPAATSLPSQLPASVPSPAEPDVFEQPLKPSTNLPRSIEEMPDPF